MGFKQFKLAALMLFSIIFVGCIEERNLSFKIADAENQYFSKSGRLFITGGRNIFEVKKNSLQEFVKVGPLFDGSCYATGIVEYKKFLYATCTFITKARLKKLIKEKRCRLRNRHLLKCLKGKFAPSYLLAAELNKKPKFQIISPLDSFLFPNGLAVDKDGNLYSADSFSKIIFKMKISSLNPYKLEKSEAWYKTKLRYPNGLKIKNNSLYITDFNNLKKVEITDEGNPGKSVVLYKSRHFLDDFSFYKRGILLTNFSKGIITLVKGNGKFVNSPKFRMRPSSILQGRSPLFKRNQFIITDKGWPYDFESNQGNRLKVITIDKFFMDEI
ncbi:MAG: hypothetical protein VXY34_09205 [Bdellovibrionota bacterium]|nr:hypothetical protein [Bdellovibrionota bacterium]|tara:strand:+ start:4997 stop:5983 length:987 start_codon:yes stop_codon:yes gene_type:complete